jgi:hypothetical protein
VAAFIPEYAEKQLRGTVYHGWLFMEIRSGTDEAPNVYNTCDRIQAPKFLTSDR